MGLLSTLGSAAINAGFNYASNKYAADSRIEGVKLQNQNVLDRVSAEHANSLERMKKEHEHSLNVLDIKHGYDMDAVHTKGKYDMFNTLISGVSQGISSGIRSGLIGGKKDGTKGNGGIGGSAPTLTTLDQKWDDLVRQMNGAAGLGSTQPKPGFSTVPISQILTTGGALATGVAGILPMIAL